MPRRQAEIPAPPLEVKRMLCSLTQSKAVLQRLLDQQSRVYAPLLRALLSWVGREQTPTLKALQQATGSTPTRCRKWLEACHTYMILLLATDAQALQVQQVEHVLYLHGKRKSAEVRCRLPVTPRLHEHMEVDLVWAETGESSFYVTSITHELQQDQLLVHLALAPGYYDPYVEMLRRRAHFEGEIMLQEEQQWSRFELEGRLQELYGNSMQRQGAGPTKPH